MTEFQRRTLRAARRQLERIHATVRDLHQQEMIRADFKPADTIKPLEETFRALAIAIHEVSKVL